MDKNYDPQISEKDVFSVYQETYDKQDATAAHDYITNNNYTHLPLYSQSLNQILELIYSGSFKEEDLQNWLGNELFAYISLPPKPWIKNSSYKVGDIVYDGNIVYSDNTFTNIVYLAKNSNEVVHASNIPVDFVYYCIKDIGNSINLNNTKFWRKIPNYYASDKSLLPKLQTWIDRLKTQNYEIWQSGKVYYKNNIVLTPDLQIGFCITNNENGTTAVLTDSSSWVIFNLQGRDGPLSLGVEWKGQWVNGGSYKAGDMVRVEIGKRAALYVAKTNLSSSTISPISSQDWMMILETGQTSIEVVVNKTEPTDVSTYQNIFLWVDSNKNATFFYKPTNTTKEPMYPQVYLNDITCTSISGMMFQDLAGNKLNQYIAALFYSKNFL